MWVRVRKLQLYLSLPLPLPLPLSLLCLWLSPTSTTAHYLESFPPFWDSMSPLSTEYALPYTEDRVKGMGEVAFARDGTWAAVHCDPGNATLGARVWVRITQHPPFAWEAVHTGIMSEVLLFTSSVPVASGSDRMSAVIAATHEGNWIVVWSAVEDAADLDYDLFFSFTHDNGWTWAPYARLDWTRSYFDGPMAHDLNPAIWYHEPFHSYVVVWQTRQSFDGKLDTDYDIAMSNISVGVGGYPSSNFSIPVFINSDYVMDDSDDRTPHLFFNPGGGELHVSYYARGKPGFGLDADIFVITRNFSNDSSSSGTSWSPPRPLLGLDEATTDTGVDHAYHAVACAFRQNTCALIMHVENTTANHHSVQITTSYDGGWTWSWPPFVISDDDAHDNSDLSMDEPAMATDGFMFVCAWSSQQSSFTYDFTDAMATSWWITRSPTSSASLTNLLQTPRDREVFYAMAPGDVSTGRLAGSVWTPAKPLESHYDQSPQGRPNPPQDCPGGANVPCSGETFRPKLMFNHEGWWVATFHTTRNEFTNNLGHALVSGYDQDFVYAVWSRMPDEVCWYRNALLPPTCRVAVQERVDLSPPMATEYTQLLLGPWIEASWGDNENATIIVSGGRRVSFRAAYGVSAFGNAMCWAEPYYHKRWLIEVADPDSGVELLAYSTGLVIRGEYVILNSGRAPASHFRAEASVVHFQYFDTCIEHQQVNVCPIGFIHVNLDDAWCTPCDEGRLCSSHTSNVTCPSGYFCPPLSQYTGIPCNVGRAYSIMDTGMARAEDCLLGGTPCGHGYFCPPAANITLHEQLMEVQGPTSFSATIVFPSTFSFQVTLRMLRGPRIPQFQPGSSVLRVVAKPSHILPWIDYPEDLLATGLEFRVGDVRTLSFTMKTRVSGVGIDRDLVDFLELDVMLEDDVVTHPINITVRRSVTTVLFQPQDGIRRTRAIMDGAFVEDLLVYSINCAESLAYSVSIGACEEDPTVVALRAGDVTADWVELGEGGFGALVVGSADPGVIQLRIDPRRSLFSRGGQLQALLPSRTRGVLEDLNFNLTQVEGLSVTSNFLDASGTVEAQTCVYVFITFNSTGLQTTTKLPIVVTLFENCPHGTYSASGTSQFGACDLCQPGTYFNATGGTQCTPCPDARPRSAPGSFRLDHCLASPGMFQDDDGVVRLCESVFGDGVECLEEGNTLRTVTVKPGWWRATSQSKQVIRCKNPSFCAGGKGFSWNGTTNSSSSSSSRGLRLRRALQDSSPVLTNGTTRLLVDELNPAPNYCREHHDPRTPLCEGCLPGYVRRGQDPCSACDAEAIAGDELRLFGIIFGGCLLVLVGFLLTQRAALAQFLKNQSVELGHRIQRVRASFVGTLAREEPPLPRQEDRRPNRWSHKLHANSLWLWRVLVSIDSSTTLRILLSLAQVTGGMSSTFYELFPSLFHNVAAIFSLISAQVLSTLTWHVS